MPQTNPKRTLYAINNDAGAYTVIRLTACSIYVTIDEDPSQNAGVKQGLQYYALDPFAQSSNILSGAEGPFVTPLSAAGIPELTFGDQHNIHNRENAPLGAPGSGGNVDVPGGQPTLGTPLVAVRTNTATATNIIVTEYV